MKQLKFNHTYAKKITDGDKRVTLRLGDPGFRVGETIELVDKIDTDKPDEWKIVGEMTVKSVHSQRLKDLTEDLLRASEIGSDIEKTVTLLRRFYGEQVNADSPVSLISFDFTAYEEPKPYLAMVDSGERVSRAIMQADGGSRGNPGPSAAGFVVMTEDRRVIKSWNKYLGITTNNQAEYHAFIAGMEWCLKHGISSLQVQLDSLLVVNQLKGKFKVKNRDLWTLYESAKVLRSKFNDISISHVPREMNKLADSEVNKALDAVKGEERIQ